MPPSLPRPLQYIASIKKKYQKLWQQIDVFLSGKGNDLPDWPDWCFCPLAAAYAIASSGGPASMLKSPADVGIIGALAAWRPTQGIYRFDPTLADYIVNTKIDDTIPNSILFGLPEWCLYIELPFTLQFTGKDICGFFVHLEFDIERKEPELRFLLDLTDNSLIPLPLHLTSNNSLQSGLEATLKEAENHSQIGFIQAQGDSDIIIDLIGKLISFVLYLCSDKPDVAGRKIFETRTKPRMIKTKKGFRMFPPDQHEVWNVGFSIGQKIRDYVDGSDSHSSPRPHIRRAHWHTFLTGPRNLPTRGSVLKWIPPLPVNFENGDEVKPTIHNYK